MEAPQQEPGLHILSSRAADWLDSAPSQPKTASSFAVMAREHWSLVWRRRRMAKPRRSLCTAKMMPGGPPGWEQSAYGHHLH